MAAYVLGSVAQGYAGSESDFDLAVVVDRLRLTSYDQVYEGIRHLEFPKNLDLAVVDTASSPLFLFQMIKTGERVYSRLDKESVELESFIMKNYYDTEHLRSIYDSYLSQKFPSPKI